MVGRGCWLIRSLFTSEQASRAENKKVKHLSWEDPSGVPQLTGKAHSCQQVVTFLKPAEMDFSIKVDAEMLLPMSGDSATAR